MSGYKSRGRSSESMIEETQRWYTRMNHQRQTHPAAGSGEYYEEMCNTNGVGERQLPMSYKNEKKRKKREALISVSQALDLRMFGIPII